MPNGLPELALVGSTNAADKQAAYEAHRALWRALNGIRFGYVKGAGWISPSAPQPMRSDGPAEAGGGA